MVNDMATSKASAGAGNGGAGPGSAGHRRPMRLGEVLIDENLISKKQLKRALSRQKQTQKNLGQTLVDMGFSTEAQILEAINRRYEADLKSLDDDLEPYLRIRGFKVEDARRGMRVPIKAKLSIAIIGIIWMTILGLSLVILTRQRAQLYDQTVKTGKVSLNYIANNARIPLINENILQLNTLVKETSSVEGVVYATITDRGGVVQAHTDPSKIRKKRQAVQNRTDEVQEGGYKYFSYTAPDGGQILDISSDVKFRNKLLGSVHVGISLDFINGQIKRESIYIILLSLFVIALGVVIAIFMGVGFSRPISELVVATREIGRGNLKHKIKKIRNDEFGDLASAFNYMSSELWRKAAMQESFGKYVGSEVLDLIMADPENAWLKGSRSNASVLFTDVRGFTSYSETRDPEAVVEALNEYLDVATRNIQEFGGYVDKFIGDAVMGVFGVPMKSDDHAEQAVRAAMAMQRQFAEVAARNGNELLKRVGIGINSGSVVSGNIGSAEKMEYTVIGDSVNVASRINGLAAAGETIISKSVLDAVHIAVKVQPLPRQKVKGKAEAIEVFKLLDIGTAAAKTKERPHAQRRSR